MRLGILDRARNVCVLFVYTVDLLCGARVFSVVQRRRISPCKVVGGGTRGPGSRRPCCCKPPGTTRRLRAETRLPAHTIPRPPLPSTAVHLAIHTSCQVFVAICPSRCTSALPITSCGDFSSARQYLARRSLGRGLASCCFTTNQTTHTQLWACFRHTLTIKVICRASVADSPLTPSGASG